jgi:hypothetical protein
MRELIAPHLPWWDGPVDSRVASVLDRLRRSRAPGWLQIIDEADLDRPAVAESDAENVVAPYLELLRRIGDGIQLTESGYLPESAVNELLTALGWDADWPGKNFREDLTRPILDLRESAQRLGLLRKYRGRMLPTKLGRALADNPTALWWHLADRLPDAKDEADVQAGILFLLLVAAGRSYSESLLTQAMSILGCVMADHSSVAGEAVHHATFETRALFRRLDLFVEKSHWAAPDVPSDQARRLARAALLGLADPPPPHLPSADRLIQLTVSLREVEPLVWRRVRVPDSLTLSQLHDVLQTAMGWQGYHPHLFEIDDVAYGDSDTGNADVADFDDRPHGDENATTIGSIAATISDFRYDYDFGDGWEHDIHIEAVTAATGPLIPVVVDGARACPPEDCGGPGGYADLLRVLADPGSNLYEHLRMRVGDDFDPDAFDKGARNERLGLHDRHTRQRGRGRDA